MDFRGTIHAMADIHATLGALGLNDKERAAYLSLLQLGPSPASAVARHAGIPRSMAQYTCQQLVQKGMLVQSRRRNAFIYAAEPPSKLLLLIERQRRALDRREHDVQTILGTLQGLMQPGRLLPRIRFYEGVAGIEQLLDDLPEERRDVCTFSAGDHILRSFPEMVKRYRKRSKKAFQSKRIIRGARDRALHAGDPSDPRVETRYFKTVDDWTVDVQIVDDLVSLISIDQRAPIGVIVQHADIARALRDVFLQLWAELPASR
jgi:sugar-specific transcriptional regulator TrmB